MSQKNFFYLFVFFLLVATSCLEEELLVADANFVFEESTTTSGKIAIITNLSTGGEIFEWTFENGNPSSSTDFNPGQIIFSVPGTHTIKLRVSNKDGSVSEIEREITVSGTSITDFSYSILINNYAPVEVQLSNLSEQIVSYDWQFSNGIPTHTTEENPSNVTFDLPGTQTITLNTISATGQIGQKIVSFEVLPPLEVDFDFSILPIDEDYNAPVKVFINNSTVSATSYYWEVNGATPSTSTQENPVFVFNAAGNYEIKLTATNGKQTQTLIKNINVLSYTNLSVQNNISLGINSAQNTIGSYYSTVQKRVYKSNEITSENGSDIDLVYFGLGNLFSSNLFISPIESSSFGLANIPNATTTRYTNKQENCNCSNVSESQFNSMIDDTFLRTLTITNENSGFNNTLVPRIIPFITADGRKGVIKVKAFVNDGANSYIVVDIKVQKSL